jgi:hypothetical protein
MNPKVNHLNNCTKCDSHLERRKLELTLSGFKKPEFRTVEYCGPCNAYYVGDKRFTNGSRNRVEPAALRHNFPKGYWTGYFIKSSRFVSLND